MGAQTRDKKNSTWGSLWWFYRNVNLIWVLKNVLNLVDEMRRKAIF